MTAWHTSFDAIGTKWNIAAPKEVTTDTWEGLQLRILDRIQKFDQAYSRFRDDSLVHQMSLNAGSYALPADGYRLLGFYEKLYHATGGKVTPLIGRVMVDAGYDAGYSFEKQHMQSPPKWEEVVTYDARSITLNQPVLLDFGAAGKGYLVDILGELLVDAGISQFTIDASGDIMHRGTEVLQIGLESPVDMSEVIGVAQLANKSLCASSGAKRRWGEFTHIIDPDKLASPRAALATWVIADDTMTADGLATALFFTNPISLQKQFDFSWAVLNNDMSLECSKDFPVELFEAI